MEIICKFIFEVTKNLFSIIKINKIIIFKTVSILCSFMHTLYKCELYSSVFEPEYCSYKKKKKLVPVLQAFLV